MTAQRAAPPTSILPHAARGEEARPPSLSDGGDLLPPPAKRGGGLGRGALPLQLLVLLLWSLLAVCLAVHFAGQAADDFFITYRYADNLARGQGFAFNPGERVFGTTEPGWALALAGVAAFTQASVPSAGTAFSALAVLLLATLALLEGQRRGRWLGAAVGGTLAVGSSLFWVNQGAAAGGVVAVLALAAVIEPKRPWVAGAVAGCAAWLRPDAMVGIAVIGLFSVRERRRLPLGFAASAAGVVSAGMALAAWFFGRPLPSTFGVKRGMADGVAQGASGFEFWLRGWDLWVRHLGGRELALLVLVLGLFGGWQLLRSEDRVGRVLAGNAVGLAIAYPLLGVNFASWYLVPMALALCFGMGGAVASVLEGARTHRLRLRGALAAVVVALAVWMASSSASFLRTWEGPPRLAVYRQAADWLREHGRAGDSFAAMEVGTIAFGSRLRAIDLVGLVTPRVAERGAAGDYLGILREEAPRFVVARPERSRLTPLLASRGFRRRYREVARFSWREGEDLVIFELKSSP